MMKRALGLITATFFLVAAAPPTGMYPAPKFASQVPAGDDIVLSNVSNDARVPTGLSFLWPITGDANRNATATLEYKETSSGTWLRYLDLVRVEPQYDEIYLPQTGARFPNTPPSFIGVITGLTPATDYDIRVVASDPDGVSGQPATQTLVVSTPRIPRDEPDAQNLVQPSTEQEIIDAFANASPGVVIRIQPGTYNFTGSLFMNADGTEEWPIVIEATDRATVILDWDSLAVANSRGIELRCNHCVLRNLTLQDVETGVRIYGGSSDPITENVSVREMHIRDVVDAVSAVGYGSSRIYIENNVLESIRPQGVDDGGGKGSGIEVVGSSIEILNNTMSGFRDSFGTSNVQQTLTFGIFAHNNKVLWGSDDGYEFDYCSHSCVSYDNYLSNVAQGLSFQPVFDGPVYAFRNIVYNSNRGPLKTNAGDGYDTFGGRIFHNTFIKAEEGWTQFGATPGDYWIKNNLFIGQGATREMHVTSVFSRTEFDYNGWFHDLAMLFTTAEYGNHYGLDFAEWVALGPSYGDNGVNDTLLFGETVFQNVTLDFDVNGWTVYRDPDAAGLDFRPDANSSAVDAGVVIPGFTEQYGNFPDLGAFPNYQMQIPTYGASWTP